MTANRWTFRALVTLAVICFADCHLYDRHRRDQSSFTVLETKRNSDGTTHEKIREHAQQLPPLPKEYEEIGELDSEGNVLVPVDDSGKVLPGYEHLIQPSVYQMTLEDIERLNNTKNQAASKETQKEIEPQTDMFEADVVPQLPKEIAPFPPQEAEKKNPDVEFDLGADYDEPSQPGAKLPSANKDYADSTEDDPDLEMGDERPASVPLQPVPVPEGNVKDVNKEEDMIDMLTVEIQDKAEEDTSKDDPENIDEDVRRIEDVKKEEERGDVTKDEENMADVVPQTETFETEPVAKDTVPMVDTKDVPIVQILEDQDDDDDDNDDEDEKEPVKTAQAADKEPVKVLVDGSWEDVSSDPEPRSPIRPLRGQFGGRPKPDAASATSYLIAVLLMFLI